MARSGASPPTAVSFRADPAKLEPVKPGFLSSVLTIILGPLVIASVPYVFRLGSLAEYWAAERDYIIWCGWLGLVLMGGVVAYHAIVSHSYFTSRISLHLDSVGLTQSGRFRTHRWKWTELPNFTYEAEKIPPNIAFHWPGQSPGSLRKGVINDLYDTPLPEIATTLNAFRDCAMSRASARPDSK